MRHTPKKLTDCPENLRESIDWLIQVRYGSGGSDGLTKLAKALKKLIEEAIEKATTSLQSEKKKLECPVKYKGNESTCQWADRLLEKLKAEKSQNSKESNTHPYSRFSENDLNRFKTSCAASHESKRSDAQKKAYDEITERQKQLDELKDKLSIFTKEDKSDGCKKLLENLCDGLETFLGFDKNSKGYDGTGIVYSDLDRLCDAVMGFLHGVLSNIKYHLGQHKDTLDSAIEALKTNKHLGKKGFNEAIGSVVAGVRGYNDAVAGSNKKVSDVITTMQNDADKYSTETLEKSLNRQNADDPVKIVNLIEATKQTVAECIEKADEFNEALDMSTNPTDIRNAIKDLNPNLSTKIENVRENIKHERERLQKLAEHEKNDLKSMEAEIKRKLHDVKCRVNEHIKKRVKDLVERLKDRVREMQTKLVDINVDLTKHLEKLQKWMKVVKEFVETARKRSETIMDEVKWDDTNTKNAKRNKIDNAATNLRKRADELYKAGELAKQKVQETVGLALEQVIKTDEAIKKDLYSVKGKIKTAVQQLGTKLVGNVKEDLTALKGKITGPLGEIVSSASEFFKTFSSTKGALDRATQALQRDAANLEDLSKIGRISEVIGSVSFLTAIGGRQHPFNSLKDYFYDIETQVISQMKDAIQNIGGPFRHSGNGVQPSYIAEFEPALSKANAEVAKFKSLFESSGRSQRIDFEQVRRELKKSLGMDFNVKEDLKLKFEKLRSFNNNRSRFSVPTPSRNEMAINELAMIVQAVSEHSKELVQQVMDKIKTKLKEEVETVGGVINTKVGMSSKLLGHEAVVGQEDSETFVGLEKLVNDFGSTIDTKLADLKRDLETGIFNKKNPLSGGIDSEHDYELGKASGLMSNFHDTYEKELKTGNIKTDDGIGKKSVVDVEIGVDGMPGAGGAAGKISDLARTNFTNYGREIIPDSVSAAASDPTQLKGELPNKIKDIQKQVATVALASIDQLNEQAGQQFKEVISNLDALCTAVKREAEIVEGNLQVLKNTQININLKDIHGLIEQLRKKQLHAVIDLTNNFLTQFADKAREQIVKDLEQDANIEVTKGETDIVHELRKRYVAFIKLLLTDFSTKCKSELNGLPAEITKDADKGAKGFMKQFEDKFIKDDKCIEGIKKIDSTSSAQEQSPLTQAAGKLNHAVRRFFSYYQKQVDFASDFTKFRPTKDALHTLLDGIRESQRFDYQFRQNLHSLNEVIGQLAPQQFGVSSTSMLQSLKEGIIALVGELNNAYISAYDSETFNGELVKNVQHVSSTNDVNVKYDLTDEGTRLSKVFLTVLRTLDVSLYTLKSNCRVLQKKRINRDTDIGKLLTEMGYVVSNLDEQNGELQDKSDMTGERILGRLIGRSGRVYSSHDDKNYEGALKDLVTHLNRYFEVCHFTILPTPRTPCNVYEMLVWLTGLPHNPVYDALLEDGLSAPFKDPAKQTKEAGDGFEFTVFDLQTSHIDAYPSNITYKNTARTIDHICSKAYEVLATIVGHGNASTVYACDFPSNTLNLKYPTGGEDCLNTLLDILRRLLPQLQYLFHRCNVTDTYYGWRNCRYGRDVPTAKWPCIDHSSDKPKHEATCQTKCKPKCQPTSPLMSYLNDCLSAHLPHQIVTVGCKSECRTCPSNSPGMPCRMPFGFRGFSGSTKTGMDICESIRLFLGSGLVSSLLCLIPRPPSTLPEHFNFALSLVNKWNGSASHVIKDAFEASIVGSSIGLYKQPSSFTKALSNAYGSRESTHARASHPTSTQADLLSLSKKESCIFAISDNVHCAPYLSSVCSDFYYYLAIKNADLYLSWAVYLPWTLYKYLKSLLDAFCNISCKDWECSRCTHGDKCKPGKHGVGYSCTCKALVHCRGVMSTFYSYGFAFGNPQTLLATEGRRYCHSFYNQLNHVLSSACFRELLTKCDEFIFTIRQPFIWLNVALWSLSLFYLTCVMVGRLDVLHIRSHLRTPSSHRITAQSLLAAAQVGRLAKISYLQP